jgi:hypothetical protein
MGAKFLFINSAGEARRGRNPVQNNQIRMEPLTFI